MKGSINFKKRSRNWRNASHRSTMLHAGIAESYREGLTRVSGISGVKPLARSKEKSDPAKTQGDPVLFCTDAAQFSDASRIGRGGLWAVFNLDFRPGHPGTGSDCTKFGRPAHRDHSWNARRFSRREKIAANSGTQSRPAYSQRVSDGRGGLPGDEPRWSLSGHDRRAFHFRRDGGAAPVCPSNLLSGFSRVAIAGSAQG